MTLYDLFNSVTLQGNIAVEVYDEAGSASRKYIDFYIRDVDDLSTEFDLESLEELEVTHIYTTKSCDGTPWTHIDLSE